MHARGGHELWCGTRPRSKECYQERESQSIMKWQSPSLMPTLAVRPPWTCAVPAEMAPYMTAGNDATRATSTDAHDMQEGTHDTTGSIATVGRIYLCQRCPGIHRERLTIVIRHARFPRRGARTGLTFITRRLQLCAQAMKTCVGLTRPSTLHYYFGAIIK